MPALYETERPKTLDEVCGHSRAKKQLNALQRSSGLLGQAVWFTGDSGTGKTTICRVLASMICDPCCTEEVDAQDVTMDLIRDWERMAQARPLFGEGYCFIINEAHGLSTKAVSRLQTVLEDERVQRNSTWLFTTTFRGEQRLFDSKMDACPFLSRCINIRLELDSETVLAMAERLQAIAQRHDLDGQPVESYLELLKGCDFNMRQALQQIACGEMLA